MRFASLRKIGRSVMLAVPPDMAKALDLKPGDKVSLSVQSGRLIVDPQRRLARDLQRSKTPRKEKDDQWTRDKAVGRELI
ncbi:MAG TPA: AbrB/MazE/SpoVT family DNA-binding domain-containing protein [Candidatus Angelobacter sp.]